MMRWARFPASAARRQPRPSSPAPTNWRPTLAGFSRSRGLARAVEVRPAAPQSPWPLSEPLVACAARSLRTSAARLGREPTSSEASAERGGPRSARRSLLRGARQMTIMPASVQPETPPAGMHESYAEECEVDPRDMVQGSYVWNSGFDAECIEYTSTECARLKRDIAFVSSATTTWRLDERAEALEEALEEAEVLRLELLEMAPDSPPREDGLTREQMLANLDSFSRKAMDELALLLRDYLAVDAVCSDLASFTQVIPEASSPTWRSIPEVLVAFLSATGRVRAFLGRTRPLEPAQAAELGRRLRELPFPAGEPAAVPTAESDEEIGFRVAHMMAHRGRKHAQAYAQSYCSHHFDAEESHAINLMTCLAADTGDSRAERLRSLPPVGHLVGYGRFLSVVENEVTSRGGQDAHESAAAAALLPAAAVEAVAAAQLSLAPAVREAVRAAGAALYGGRLEPADYLLERAPRGDSELAAAARRALEPVSIDEAHDADLEALRAVLVAIGQGYTARLEESLLSHRFSVRSIEAPEPCPPHGWELSAIFKTGVRVMTRTGTPYATIVKPGTRTPMDEFALAGLFGRLFAAEERRRAGVVPLRYEAKRWALEEHEHALGERGLDIGPHDPYRVRGAADAADGALAALFELRAARGLLTEGADPDEAAEGRGGRRAARALLAARRLARLGLFMPAVHDFQRALLAIEGLREGDRVKAAAAARAPALLHASLEKWYGEALPAVPAAHPPAWAAALADPTHAAAFADRFGLLAGAALFELEREAGGPEAFAPRLAALAADLGRRPAPASFAAALGPEGDPALPAFWERASAGLEAHCRLVARSFA